MNLQIFHHCCHHTQTPSPCINTYITHLSLARPRDPWPVWVIFGIRGTVCWDVVVPFVVPSIIVTTNQYNTHQMPRILNSKKKQKNGSNTKLQFHSLSPFPHLVDFLAVCLHHFQTLGQALKGALDGALEGALGEALGALALALGALGGCLPSSSS